MGKVRKEQRNKFQWQVPYSLKIGPENLEVAGAFLTVSQLCTPFKPGHMAQTFWLMLRSQCW